MKTIITLIAIATLTACATGTTSTRSSHDLDAWMRYTQHQQYNDADNFMRDADTAAQRTIDWTNNH